MKRFVAVCSGVTWFGTQSVVIGVNASTAKSAEKKARALAKQACDFAPCNPDVVVECVTDEALKALADNSWEHYLFLTGCKNSKDEVHKTRHLWKRFADACTTDEPFVSYTSVYDAYLAKHDANYCK